MEESKKNGSNGEPSEAMPEFSGNHPLEFHIIAECPVTKARVSKLKLPHASVDTPVFMPVGTQGTLKGLLPEQVLELGCQIILGNTYHLGHRPGHELVKKAGGLHKFMNWPRNLLTDSGGFQMVSLSELMEITEEGVTFQSPHTKEKMLLSPEMSIHIQNSLGADIMMQLDDVVHSLTTGPRVEEAMHRTLRWLDRSIAANQRPREQNIFGIVQGGLDLKLREYCVAEMTKRDLPGFAIGGLSGGEDKDNFWPVVNLCTGLLPRDKPRYVMGVGWPIDLVVCVALGADMFDCVFPTRTARFGSALTDGGLINLGKKEFARDFTPIDSDCECSTCTDYTKASINNLMGDTVACHLVSIHNIAYQLRLMKRIRAAIVAGTFPDFIRNFVKLQFPDGKIPKWTIDALSAVNINLVSG